MVQITSSAALQIKEMLLEKQPPLERGGLRVTIEGGGCSGRQYVLLFDGPKEKDHIFRQDEACVYVDPESLSYLDGSTIDYVGGLTGVGFKIINPNAKQTCGCGTSFEA